MQHLHSTGFTVLAPDRPGWGSRRQEAPRGFAANADAAARVLDEAGAGQAVVVGYSWGGGVALALARLYPARVAGLVLVASVGPGAISLTDRILALPVVGPWLGGASLAVTSHSLRSPRLRAAWGRGLGTLDEAEVLTVAAASKGRHSRRSFFTEQRALVGELPGLLAGLGAITVPTCVVTGEDDRLLSSATARGLADAIPGATLRVVPGAGHLLPITHPEAAAQAVIKVAAGTGWRCLPLTTVDVDPLDRFP